MRGVLIALAALVLGACASTAGAPPSWPESLAGVAEIRPELVAPRLVVLTPVEQRLVPLYARRATAERTAAAEIRAGRMTPERGMAVRALSKDALARLQTAEIAEAKVRSAPAAQQATLGRELEASLTAATLAVAETERLAGVKR